nr:trna wybutosine-synthesizing protein 2/3/4 [Quercus suber]
MCGIGNGSSRCSSLEDSSTSLSHNFFKVPLPLSHTISSKSIVSHAWVFLSEGVADRVCLGLIPTSEGSWVTTVRALRFKYVRKKDY